MCGQWKLGVASFAWKADMIGDVDAAETTLQDEGRGPGRAVASSRAASVTAPSRGATPGTTGMHFGTYVPR